MYKVTCYLRFAALTISILLPDGTRCRSSSAYSVCRKKAFQTKSFELSDIIITTLLYKVFFNALISLKSKHKNHIMLVYFRPESERR